MDSLSKILQKSNTKRICTNATYSNHISHIITTKNKETCTNTDHNNTYTYLGNKKLIAIRWHHHSYNQHNYQY